MMRTSEPSHSAKILDQRVQRGVVMSISGAGVGASAAAGTCAAACFAAGFLGAAFRAAVFLATGFLSTAGVSGTASGGAVAAGSDGGVSLDCSGSSDEGGVGAIAIGPGREEA